MTETVAPDWDMRPYFSEFGGADYRAFRAALEADAEALADRLARLEPLGAAGEEGLERWAEALEDLEGLWSRSGHLAGYLGCLGAADARDPHIKQETASAAAARVQVDKLFVGVRAALRDVDDEQLARLAAHPRLIGAGHFLRRARVQGRSSMEPALEELAAELGVDGIAAWGRLYDRISGTLEFDLEEPGGTTRRLPVAMTRTFLEDADPAIRRATLRGANDAWASVGETTAACLNAISGTRLTLYAERGIDDFLEPALFDACIGARTLDTMVAAVLERAEIPRRYLRTKARLLGLDRLGFHDLMAPLPALAEGGAAAERVTYAAARATIVEAFGRFYPALARFAEEAFERRWIDHAPRAGKRPGGFCSTSHWIGESRIFVTFNGAAGDVATLAHELGHAWHSRLMRELRPWACRSPMTLSETASTFAENLVIDAVLAEEGTTPDQRARTLDGRMQDASAYLLNILMRYRFERRVYSERAAGELGVERLCELMLESQREIYGDALDPDALDPWFWASKLHFYITGLSFYNFPYTFGYLFSLGIFARARREGPGFLPAYEDMLRQTGSDSAESIARRCLDVDLGEPAFWNASLDLIEADLSAFESATAGR